MLYKTIIPIIFIFKHELRILYLYMIYKDIIIVNNSTYFKTQFSHHL